MQTCFDTVQSKFSSSVNGLNSLSKLFDQNSELSSYRLARKLDFKFLAFDAK